LSSVTRAIGELAGGSSIPPLGLQASHVMPTLTQSHASARWLVPRQGRSGCSSQTQPVSSQTKHAMNVGYVVVALKLVRTFQKTCRNISIIDDRQYQLCWISGRLGKGKFVELTLCPNFPLRLSKFGPQCQRGASIAADPARQR
jgi:hypothetical protein